MKPEIVRDPDHWRYMLRKVHHPLATTGGIKKLNVGSGWCVYDGFTNVDIADIPGVEQIDLFQFPWPWPDNTFDYILASEFLEHVPNDKIMGVIENLGRVLKFGGTVEVMCPHPATFMVLFQIPGHHRLVGEYTFEVFSKDYHTNSGEHNEIKRKFTLEVEKKIVCRGFRLGRLCDYHVRKYLRFEFGLRKAITLYVVKGGPDNGGAKA